MQEHPSSTPTTDGDTEKPPPAHLSRRAATSETIMHYSVQAWCQEHPECLISKDPAKMFCEMARDVFGKYLADNEVVLTPPTA